MPSASVSLQLSSNWSVALHYPDGRTQSCELRDNSRSGAGGEVMLLENGEPVMSHRSAEVIRRRARNN